MNPHSLPLSVVLIAALWLKWERKVFLRVQKIVFRLALSRSRPNLSFEIKIDATHMEFL